MAEQEQREAAEQESVGVLLRRGGYVSLTEEAPDLTTAVIGLGWETTGPAQEEFELDASALLVDGQGGVIDDQSFVFYNNLKSPDGSVEHSGDSLDDAEEGDRAQIRVWLPGVPAEAARIVFALTIYDAEARRQTFAQVRHAYIRAVDAASGRQIARYDFENVFAAENAVILGELHRHRTGWRFRATGEGYTSGLFGIARSFGVNV
ncbi:TerD family protein [Streptomyces sp. NPDC017988]|uniref:TerD family protein n=1 Tax=Streptomyces sp. NPDC017988 TaxID=3365025 RepID=UPI0037957953